MMNGRDVDTLMARQLQESMERNAVLATKNQNLRAEIATLTQANGVLVEDNKRLCERASELLAFNNQFEERARSAERELKRLKTIVDRILATTP